MMIGREQGKWDKFIEFGTSAIGFFLMVFIIGSSTALMMCFNAK